MVLTDWEARRFRGGETMILRPGVLDYWGSMYRRNRGLEQEHLVQLVEPHFNRLTVFDPRCDYAQGEGGVPLWFCGVLFIVLHGGGLTALDPPPPVGSPMVCGQWLHPGPSLHWTPPTL